MDNSNRINHPAKFPDVAHAPIDALHSVSRAVNNRIGDFVTGITTLLSKDSDHPTKFSNLAHAPMEIAHLAAGCIQNTAGDIAMAIASLVDPTLAEQPDAPQQ